MKPIKRSTKKRAEALNLVHCIVDYRDNFSMSDIKKKAVERCFTVATSFQVKPAAFSIF